MAQFRRKPDIVEAHRAGYYFSLARNSWYDLPKWIQRAYDDGNLIFEDKSIFIRNHRGIGHAQWDDWLVNDPINGIFTCRDEDFRANFELIEEPVVASGDING